MATDLLSTLLHSALQSLYLSDKPPDFCDPKSKMAHDAATVSTPTFHQGREVLISGFLQHHLCAKVGNWKLLQDRGESPLIDMDGPAFPTKQIALF